MQKAQDNFTNTWDEGKNREKSRILRESEEENEEEEQQE